MIDTRITRRFALCANENRPAFVAFVTAGDPDVSTSQKILRTLTEAGTDIIELGMPFSDPMAEGIPIQLSSQRALKAGQNMVKTLEMVREFREFDSETPIVLMGYYNPIYSYGNERFLKQVAEIGVDGLIIVDLPPEADDELCIPALSAGINFIRLATPTTDSGRLPAVLNNTSGFVYYVSITGITGTSSPDTQKVKDAVFRIKSQTNLPVAVGFGVKTPEQAGIIGRDSDGVVIGSAIVDTIRKSLTENGDASENTVSDVYELVSSLAKGVKQVKVS